MKEKIYIPKCFICLDRGFIFYRKKVGELEGEYVAHCTCKAGKDYAYDGSQCKKQKSQYYTPGVDEILDYVNIGENNFHEWQKRNKDKQGFDAAMSRLGISEEAPDDEPPF